MNKNTLKEKRRETVTGLLKGMTIKKATKGGFDKDDVYACIQELCNLYEDHIDELENNYEGEIGELTKRYQKYDENNELYVSLIMEAKKSSNEIINQAKSEVDEILNKGREQIELQEKQLEQFKADSARGIASMQAELETRKDAAEAEKAAMKVEVEAEKEKLEATKLRYRQQITAMEDEFAEIRTNILRTSARLDSLKSKTEETTPGIRWEVEETDTAVQIPEPDVAIEDVIEIMAEEPALENEATFEETFFRSEVLEDVPKAMETPAPDYEFSFEEETKYNPESIEPEGVESPVEEAAIETPAEELMGEVTIRELLRNMDALAEQEMPVEEEKKAETEAVEASEPADFEPPLEEAAIETPAEEDDIESLLSGISFDDVLEEGDSEAEDGIEEISIAELEAIEAEIVAETPTEESSEPDGVQPREKEVTTAAAAAGISEEISFKGLEELFKDEA